MCRRPAPTAGPWPRPWPPRCSDFRPSPSATWSTSCAGRRSPVAVGLVETAGGVRSPQASDGDAVDLVPPAPTAIWSSGGGRRPGHHQRRPAVGPGTERAGRCAVRDRRGGAPGGCRQSVRRGARPPPAEPSVAGRSRRARGVHPAWRRVAPGRSGDERPLDRTSPAAGHPVPHEPGDPLLIRLGQVRPSIVPLEARSQLGSLPASQPMKCSRTPGRRCSGMAVTDTAPASTQASTTSASCSGESDSPGMIGATSTPVGMPASLSLAARPHPLAWVGGARLGRLPHRLVERADGEVAAHVGPRRPPRPAGRGRAGSASTW